MAYGWAADQFLEVFPDATRRPLRPLETIADQSRGIPFQVFIDGRIESIFVGTLSELEQSKAPNDLSEMVRDRFKWLRSVN